MKAISLHQPWASLIADGQKTIETRYWSTNYRGDLLICSTIKVFAGTWSLPRGKALCIVELYDCKPMKKRDEDDSGCVFDELLYSWFLRNIRPIKRFPVRGRQRIFEVDYAESQ